MYKYVIAAIVILALLVLLQRGCQSGAERRWERRQERYEWKQRNKEDRKENRGWREKTEPIDDQSQENERERQWRIFRRRSASEQAE